MWFKHSTINYYRYCTKFWGFTKTLITIKNKEEYNNCLLINFFLVFLDLVISNLKLKITRVILTKLIFQLASPKVQSSVAYWPYPSNDRFAYKRFCLARETLKTFYSCRLIFYRRKTNIKSTEKCVLKLSIFWYIRILRKICLKL